MAHKISDLSNESTDGSKKTFQRLTGYQAWEKVVVDSNRLLWSKSFDSMLRFMGFVFLILGSLFVCAPWLGISIEGAEDAVWLPTFLGALFAIVGSIFLFGQRRVEIDRLQHLVTFSWCCLFLSWSKLQTWRGIPKLEIDESQEIDSEGHQYGVNRIMLETETQKIQLFQFLGDLDEEIRELARELADFLKTELRHKNSKDISRA